MPKEVTARILVSRDRLDIDEDGRGARGKYPVFEQNKERVILEVPEDEAEEIARRLGGLLEMSE